MPWWINNPPQGGDSFSWQRWFLQVYRFIRGENRTYNTGGTLSLSTATNLSEDFLYPCDATSAGFTVTLPLAANYQYKKYCIKKIDSSANIVTIARSGSDTIDGATTKTLTAQYNAITLVSDGVSKWHSECTGGGSSGIAFTGNAWVTLIGGGGGGITTSVAGNGGGGGGAGELVEQFQLKLTPGASYSYSVGTGGATDTDGTSSTFSILTALGGKKGVTTVGGIGGGARGGTGGVSGNPGGTGSLGTAETSTAFGGSGGGGGGGSTTSNGGPGGGSAGYLVGGAGGINSGTQAGGGGGAATPYGRGGAGGAGGAVGVAAASTDYGAGGGGGGGHASGSGGAAGAGGYILVAYLGGATEFTSGSGTWTAPS